MYSVIKVFRNNVQSSNVSRCALGAAMQSQSFVPSLSVSPWPVPCAWPPEIKDKQLADCRNLWHVHVRALTHFFKNNHYMTWTKVIPNANVKEWKPVCRKETTFCRWETYRAHLSPDAVA